MALLPPGLAAKVEFYEVHAPRWVLYADVIGLTEGDAAAVAELTAEARAALLAQGQALAAARAATARVHDAVARLRAAGGNCVRKIRAAAEAPGASPEIYDAALLPPPARPAKLPPPGTPARLDVALRGDGALALSWKARHPANADGVVYELRRSARVAGRAEEMVHIATVGGGVGGKRFVDRTVPAGATRVTYEITALRSNARGRPAEFVVPLTPSPHAAPHPPHPATTPPARVAA